MIKNQRIQLDVCADEDLFPLAFWAVVLLKKNSVGEYRT